MSSATDTGFPLIKVSFSAGMGAHWVPTTILDPNYVSYSKKCPKMAIICCSNTALDTSYNIAAFI